jgi:hypothetical protein
MELDVTEVLNSSNGVTNIIFELYEWPVYSPDFNAIELLSLEYYQAKILNHKMN